MTNNPTIDGVSRELLQHAFNAVNYLAMRADDIGSSNVPFAEALRALLDAPDVEPINDLREHCKQCAEVVKTWPEWKQNCLGGAPVVERQPVAEVVSHWSDYSCVSLRVDGTLRMYVESCKPEPVAALQSTIAQLQARIAELESGRGEPVAFIQIPKNVEKYGHADQADRLCFGKPGQFFVDGKSPMFDFIPLYTAPPAPVAVVLPKREMFHGEMDNQEIDFSRGWNACLDATAALNNKK